MSGSTGSPVHGMNPQAVNRHDWGGPKNGLPLEKDEVPITVTCILWMGGVSMLLVIGDWLMKKLGG